MNMPHEQALAMLLDLMGKDHESDITTILEQWRTSIEQYETAQLAQRMAQLPPQVYGISYGEPVEASSDDSHQFYNHQVLAKYRIKREDLPAFASEHGLDLKQLMQVMDGKVQDLRGYRSMYFHGSMNRPFTPAKEQMSLQERKQETSRPFDPTSSSFVPASKPSYRTMPEPSVQEWTPKQKANN